MTTRSDLRDARCGDCGARCIPGETHAQHNAGWLKKVLLWDWHEIIAEGFQGWDRNDDGEPPSMELTLVSEIDKSSTDIDREFDDVAKGRFYSRDFSNSGSPCVSKGEAYRSRWWFEKREDAYAFALKYNDAKARRKVNLPNPEG